MHRPTVGLSTCLDGSIRLALLSLKLYPNWTQLYTHLRHCMGSCYIKDCVIIPPTLAWSLLFLVRDVSSWGFGTILINSEHAMPKIYGKKSLKWRLMSTSAQRKMSFGKFIFFFIDNELILSWWWFVILDRLSKALEVWRKLWIPSANFKEHPKIGGEFLDGNIWHHFHDV